MLSINALIELLIICKNKPLFIDLELYEYYNNRKDKFRGKLCLVTLNPIKAN